MKLKLTTSNQIKLTLKTLSLLKTNADESKNIFTWQFNLAVTFSCISIQRKWEKYYENALTPLLTNIKFQSFTFSFNSNHPNQSIQMKLQPFEMKRCRNGLLFFLDHSFMALTFVTLFKRIQQTIGYTFCPFTGSLSFNQEWKVFSFRWPKWQREKER